ncbi:MAG: SIR2 family protein [Acidobacteria bacterium]|nr:SIR2 family protein [Acidobacteriota bacterium]MBV9070665.1 SIR2 family protein [Acidobacteriota bacterium]MBV9478148.1 SIR2 family protein [Acidobacteriota bacterium]
MTPIDEFPGNGRAIPALRSAITRTGVTPFVGAGLSFPYGFPLWASFLRDCSAEAAVDVRQRIARGEFEEAAEDILAARGRAWFDREISRIFGKAPRKQRDTAAELVPRLARGAVVTTNFDHVLEEVFLHAQLPFDHELWSGLPLLAKRALREQQHVLIKIHGDARTPRGRVLTRSEYDQHYAEDAQLAEMLVALFSAKPVLFLGCRVESDRYLRLIRRAGRRQHFAILPAPAGDASRKKRAAALARLGIRPIWYVDGEYPMITAFLAALAPARRANRLAEEKSRAVEALEKRVAAARTADEKLDVFMNNDRMFWTGGLARDYARVGGRMLRLAEKHGRSCIALRIGSNMASMRLWDDRYVGRMLRRCERHVPHCRDPWTLQDYRYNLAIYNEERDRAFARSIYRALLRSTRPGTPAAASRRLAEMELEAGAPAKRVERLFRHSIALSRNEPEQEARGYDRLAAFFRDRGKHAEAEDAYRRAARLYARLRDRNGVGGALNEAGILALHQHRFRDAERAFRRALPYAQVAGSSDLVRAVRVNLAWLLYEEALVLRDRKGMAPAVYRKLEESDEHLADVLAQQRGGVERARTLTQRALLTAILDGDIDAAIAELATAAPTLRKHNDPWLWTNYFNRGIVLRDAGQKARARRAFATAADIARRRGNDADRRRALREIDECE